VRRLIAIVELLVPLTWSLEIAELDFKVNHHKHVPYLRLAQVEYKRAILQHDSKKILRQIIRVGLPSIAEARRDRSVRDDGIIKLVLYAIRNVAMISQPDDLPADCDEAEISRSTTIDVFHSQDVFQLLLTISSSMGEEFDVQDVVILEVLFYLLKGIDPAKLFIQDDQLSQSNADELRELMRREKAMLSGYARYAPTRHNRFGTMVWLRRDEERLSTVSGQAAISGPNRGMMYLDKAKKVNQPKRPRRNVEENKSVRCHRSPVAVLTLYSTNSTERCPFPARQGNASGTLLRSFWTHPSIHFSLIFVGQLRENWTGSWIRTTCNSSISSAGF
jgi:replication fork protection complex subunit Tof1/Swi1